MNKLEVLNKVVKDIEDAKIDGSPLFVGINGVDTSGKTTITKEISEILLANNHKVQVISIDEFHNPKAIRYQGDNPITSYIEYAFNLEFILKNILKPRIVNKTFSLLDLDTDEYSFEKKIRISEESIVLFEGVLLFRDPIKDYFDLKIFIDISFNEVLNRAVIRDYHIFGEETKSRYETKYIPIQKLYIKKWNPKGQSQIIIDNNDYNNPIFIQNKRPE